MSETTEDDLMVNGLYFSERMLWRDERPTQSAVQEVLKRLARVRQELRLVEDQRKGQR